MAMFAAKEKSTINGIESQASTAVQSFLTEKNTRQPLGEQSAVPSKEDVLSQDNDIMSDSAEPFDGQQVFMGSMNSLVLDAKAQDVSKVMGLYSQGSGPKSAPSKESSSNRGKNYDAEKRLLAMAASGIQAIKAKLGKNKKGKSGKKIDLSFFFRTLQWLAFYYETVRRDRMTKILNRRKHQQNKSHQLNEFLTEMMLQDCIQQAQQEMEDLEQPVLVDVGAFGKYEVSCMVAGVFVSCIVAMLAKQGKSLSKEQTQTLRKAYKDVHHSKFVDAKGQIISPEYHKGEVFVVSNPPVILSREAITELVTTLNQHPPITVSQAAINELVVRDGEVSEAVGRYHSAAHITQPQDSSTLDTPQPLDHVGVISEQYIEQAMQAALALTTQLSGQQMNDTGSDVIDTEMSVEMIEMVQASRPEPSWG